MSSQALINGTVHKIGGEGGSSGGAATGSYTGNGSQTRTLTFDFVPAVIVIYGYPAGYLYPDTKVEMLDETGKIFGNNGSNLYIGGTCSWNGKSVTLTAGDASFIRNINASGAKYCYFALLKA